MLMAQLEPYLPVYAKNNIVIYMVRNFYYFMFRDVLIMVEPGCGQAEWAQLYT